jgi:nucleotide-binding universal stress UspA family protein
VGLDDTDDSQNALVQATELVEVGNMELLAVHIRHLPTLPALSQASMRRTVEDLDLVEAAARRAAADVLGETGVEWEFIVRSGDPADELVRVANERSAAAIVIGGRPHRAAVSVAVGSIDTALVQRFRGPVLVVRGEDSAWYRGSEASLSIEEAIDAIYGDRISQCPEQATDHCSNPVTS